MINKLEQAMTAALKKNSGEAKGSFFKLSPEKHTIKVYSYKTIVEEVEKLVPKVDASFVIDNLEYLHKGGRCSALAMLGANLLKLKPCIEVKNGSMGVGKKYRGKFGEVLKQYN